MTNLGRFGNNLTDGRGGFKQHTKVGSYWPNVWGLYDMHGNVAEWCLDYEGIYTPKTVSDPVGASEGESRVIRGGCWDYDYLDCRSACRQFKSPSFRDNTHGFRIVCLPFDQ